MTLPKNTAGLENTDVPAVVFSPNPSNPRQSKDNSSDAQQM
jgi:hypothetical protein